MSARWIEIVGPVDRGVLGRWIEKCWAGWIEECWASGLRSVGPAWSPLAPPEPCADRRARWRSGRAQSPPSVAVEGQANRVLAEVVVLELRARAGVHDAEDNALSLAPLSVTIMSCVHNIHVKCCDSQMHGRSTCTCQCHLFWHHSSKVAPARHPWPARGDGLSESTVATNLNPPGPTIHRPNTPQSTGPTLLNPPAQHFSIHRPNTPRSTGTIIHPPKIHPHDTFGIIHWTDKSTGPTNLNPPS